MAEEVPGFHLDLPQARARELLQPAVDYYNAFYSYWAGEATIGPTFVQVVDACAARNSDGHAGGQPPYLDMMRLAEVLGQAKIGWNSRWCKGNPGMSVCCGAASFDELHADGANGSLDYCRPLPPPLVAPQVVAWIEAATAEAVASLAAVWADRRRELGPDTPDIASCCSAAALSVTNSVPVAMAAADRLPIPGTARGVGGSNGDGGDSGDSGGGSQTNGANDKGERSAECAAVWDRAANGPSCGDRIQWLVSNRRLTERQARIQVGLNEFPLECGACGK
jgi:hypothetical protein